jgi:hypothetical protein
MRKIASGLILGVVLATGPCLAAGGSIRPINLTCEHLVNPQGLDARQPRLAWRPQTQSPETRGQTQAAYQILVSGSRQNLAAGKGDLWGRPAANAPGIRFLCQENGAAIFEVGSGRYSFVSR